MKIHQLSMGARFEYEGKAYVKTGPQERRSELDAARKAFLKAIG